MNGLEVIVKFQETPNGLREERGIITQINPWVKLCLERKQEADMEIPFVGMSAGIYKIQDNDGKILYENKGVLEAYKNPQQRIPLVWGIMHDSFYEKTKSQEVFLDIIPIPPEALELREKGTFYLDLK